MKRSGALLLSFVVSAIAQAEESPNPSPTRVPEPKLSCFGQPIDGIRLPQFGEATDQRDRATCYAHAAAAVISAALYRKNGHQTPIPPEYVAIASTTVGEHAEIATRIKSIGIDLRDPTKSDLLGYLDMGSPYKSAKTILEQQRAPIDVDPKLWHGKFLDFNQKLAQSALAASQSALSIAAQEGLPDRQRKLSEASTELEEHIRKKEGVASRGRDINSRLSSSDPSIRSKAEADQKAIQDWNDRLLSLKNTETNANQELQKVVAKMDSANLIAADIVCHDGQCFRDENLKKNPADLRDFEAVKIYSPAPYLDSSETIPSPAHVDPKDAAPCTPADNQRATDALLKGLCVGLPPMLSVKANYLSIQEKGSSEWRPYTGTGGHAVTVIGITRSSTGESSILVRDSNGGGGTSVMPLKSACRIMSLATVASRKTMRGEAISEMQALAQSTTTSPFALEVDSYKIYRSRIASGLIKIDAPDQKLETAGSSAASSDQKH